MSSARRVPRPAGRGDSRAGGAPSRGGRAAPSSSTRAAAAPRGGPAARGLRRPQTAGGAVPKPTGAPTRSDDRRPGKGKAQQKPSGKAPLPPGASVKTALVIIPPEDLWPKIQAIRAKHDKAYARWMPHINLIFPWIQEEDFGPARERLTELLADFPPLMIRLEHMQEFVFNQEPYFSTLSLRPEVIVNRADFPSHGPFRGLIDLHHRVTRPYPKFHEVDPLGFRAHLTLGQLRGGSHRATRQAIEATWTPVQFLADRIHLIARTDSEPFRIIDTVVLGSSSASIPASLPSSRASSSSPAASAFDTTTYTNDPVLIEQAVLQVGSWIHKLYADPRRRSHLPQRKESLAKAITPFCSGSIPFVNIDDLLQTLVAREVISTKGAQLRIRESDAASSSSAPVVEYDPHDVSFEAAFERAKAWVHNPKLQARPRSVASLKNSLKPFLSLHYRIDPYRIIDILEEHRALDVSPTGKVCYD